MVPAYTMSTEYESVAQTVTEDAEYQVLMNPDAVRSEVIDAADARQHELENIPRYSPENSPRSPAVHRYESVRMPEPEPEPEVVVQDNSYVAVLLREYELLPPPQQKGKRMKVLVDLKRYEKLGFALSQHYTINSDYFEMVHERDAIFRLKEREKNVNIAGQVFFTLIQALEWTSERYRPFGLRLKGLSDTTFAHMDDYHEVLGELMDKYTASGSRMEPELKLAFLLFGGIFANHSVQVEVENTMLDGTAITRAGKEAAFRQIRNTVVGPAREGAVRQVPARAGLPRGRPAAANGVPIGGFPQPDTYPRPEQYAEVKEFHNGDPDVRIQEELKEELKSMQTPVSVDTAGKPRRSRKGGRAIKV